MRLLVTICCLFLVVGAVQGQDRWQIANENIVRLAPRSFTELPSQIVADLEERKCTIPQSWHVKERHNVVRGEFARKGQSDWAVLCSENRESSILIYWMGNVRDVDEIAEEADSSYLQVVATETIGFSRIINPVGSEYINRQYKEYGGPKPPKIDHDGLNNAFAEKASTVFYYHSGRWLELQGAD